MISFISPISTVSHSFNRHISLSKQLIRPSKTFRTLSSRANKRYNIILSAKKSSPNEDDKLSNSTSKTPGISITRRRVIQVLNAVLGVFTVTLIIKMKEQFRLMSPKTILSAFGLSFLPTRTSAAPATSTESSSEVRKAIAYLNRLESRPTILCPDFATNADWINSGPLSLRRQLSGKIVLLDFFTYCCINCQHVLPKLRAIESKYGPDGSGGVVVVGVHSAKFSAERETANIAAAVDRYDVKHPVINDEEMKLWNALGVSSWPTLALVGPKGNLLALWSGERQEEDIDTVITAAIEFYSDILDHRPLPQAPASASAAVISQKKSSSSSSSPLRYPGKLTLNSKGTELFIADSGNHRIVQVDSKTGEVIHIFGSGEPGLKDSSSNPRTAKFFSPQGVALYNDDNILFVADTEAHAIRAIDLQAGSVVTVGGNGEQGFDYRAGKAGTSQLLSSPWDVEVVNDYLYVAIAGTHQLWGLPLSASKSNGKVDLSKLTRTPWEIFSGSGRELEKNSSNGILAGWAQPSHLSSSRLQDALFVADSESSTVRSIDIVDKNHPTKTLAGGDGMLAENLFAFGDKEGRGSRAKFQHPLAVCSDLSEDQNRVLVADSYNHRIKTVDVESGSASYFCGSGKPGFKDGSAKDAMFWEPGGLSMAPDGSKLYVADTNNSAVRIIDTKSRAVSTLQIVDKSSSSGVGEQNGQNKSKRLIFNRNRAVKITCDEKIKRDTVATFTINLPNQTHFTPGTTSRYQVNVLQLKEEQDSDGLVELLDSGSISQNKSYGSFTVDLGKAWKTNAGGAAGIEVEAVTYYCTDVDEVCRIESDVFTIDVANDGTGSASISHTIVPKKKASMATTASKT